MVSGGWISWNYNQLSQAKAKAETDFGKIMIFPRLGNAHVIFSKFFKWPPPTQKIPGSTSAHTTLRKSKLNDRVEIELYSENKYTTKKYLDPALEPQNKSHRAQKGSNDFKNQKVRNQKSYKIKVISLYE